MRTLNSMKLWSVLLAVSFVAFSCSEDDDNGNGGEPTSKKLYTSNNSNGNVTIYDVTDAANITTTSLITTSVAADGVFYDSSTDAVIQASRSGLSLEGFTGISGLASGTAVSVGITGSTDLVSPREVAVRNDFYVVADSQDVDGDPATLDGRLFIYERSGGTFTLRNTITTDFKLWGITFIGSDLYAVVDADNELAVYTNFLSNSTDATLSASKRIVVEGIVRTHGLTYDGGTDTMIMTDIGSAMNTQDDGGFHVISNFTSKFNATANGETLSVGQQVRVAGASTLMGNPVDVAYDGETGTVFIAEAGNGGGRILAFTSIGSGGNLTPAVNNDLGAASAVYLSIE
uniref:hypothetical protein n=2 Tax=Gelidibacter sp. TaxID=2018083 RepID=UPI004049B6D1